MSELSPILQAHLEALTAKQQRLAGMSPLPPELVRSLEHKLRIELTHASNAIEGNTLTLRETQLLIDEGITPAGNKSLREIHEAINHNEAVKLLYTKAQKSEAVSEHDVLDLHGVVLKNIDDNWAGRYRNMRVFVTGSPLIPPNPQKVPALMAEFIAWLGNETSHPVKLAADAHYRFAKIHPFVDGNGRTARLLMNLVLLKYQYPLTVIQSERRAEYITSMDEGDRGEFAPFYQVIFQAVERSLDLYLGTNE